MSDISKPSRSNSKPPANTDTAAKKMELGLMGAILGGSQNAPVAAASILGFFSLVGAIALLVCSKSEHAFEAFKTLTGLTVACLSFIGGSYTGKSK
ncbi:hypothetical protein [Bosea sp. AK1]|uniref:hypothetical protein n=1 Tax=Bosea sp. AK1 TaxID=2587160 RepID=UPI001151CAF3|nr:hypothetical protein [Bosea sp. AK1]